MPLPLAVPVIIAAGATIVGVMKSCDAWSDTRKARELDSEARQIVEHGAKRRGKARKRCRRKLKKLGRLKLAIHDRQLGRFVALYDLLREVELPGSPRSHRLGKPTLSREELVDMREMSDLAGRIVRGGATALGTGALAGLAAYGSAAMFGSASTGIAISALNGAAATNATLAWLGGGSLAAGGMGIAGGTAVLGGIVAAPVLDAGGLVWSAEARKNLAAAERNMALAKKSVAEMKDAALVFEEVRKIARQHRDMIARLDERITPVLDDLAAVIRRNGCDYSKYTRTDRRKGHLAVTFARGLKLILDAPLVTGNGLPDEDHAEALKRGRRLLDVRGLLPRKQDILHVVGRLLSFLARSSWKCISYLSIALPASIRRGISRRTWT